MTKAASKSGAKIQAPRLNIYRTAAVILRFQALEFFSPFIESKPS